MGSGLASLFKTKSGLAEVGSGPPKAIALTAGSAARSLRYTVEAFIICIAHSNQSAKEKMEKKIFAEVLETRVRNEQRQHGYKHSVFEAEIGLSHHARG